MTAPKCVVITAKAVVQQQRDLVLVKVHVPELQPHQVYVKVETAAFNPTDRLAFDLHAFGDGAVLGCDFVGTVIHSHPSVTKLQIGDRVAALVWGGEIKGVGAYSTCCIADERIAFKVPASIGNRQACAIPLAANTAYLALFSEGSLNLSRGHSGSDLPLLVWGGSSVVGYLAIQMAKRHGYKVATTCSPRNFDYVKKAGASYVFDYNDPDVVNSIRSALPTLAYVFDTIGSVDSSSLAAAAMNNRIGVICTVRPGKANTEGVPQGVKVTDVFVFTAFPTPHTYRGSAHWPIIMENHQLSAELYGELPRLLVEGSITPPPVKTLGRLGPTTVLEAMQLNRTGKVSAEKLCFDVPDDL